MPSTGQGPLGEPTPETAAQQAFRLEKEQLAREYLDVKQGKVSLAQWEAHKIAFMRTYHLGNEGNLRRAMATATEIQRNVTTPIIKPSGSRTDGICSITTSLNGEFDSIHCEDPQPVRLAQYPQFQADYCGPATLATVLVNNSFTWPDTNRNGSDVINYDPYIISQPSHIAYPAEQMLAQWHYARVYPGSGGTNVTSMNNTLNAFVNGKGGWYIQTWKSGNFTHDYDTFRRNLVADVDTGWKIAFGIIVPDSVRYSLSGYPSFRYINHWLTAMNYGYEYGVIGARTHIADPLFGAPDFQPPEWNISGPISSESTTTLVSFMSVYIW
jgi:hypothetical protein